MSDYILSEGFQETERGEVVGLLREYETQIGVSLSFQDFAAELADLPGAYAPPGCVAVRPVSAAGHQCEMKRLYVRAEARKSGLGRRLALAAIAAGRRLGYQTICLDTLPSMLAAQALYTTLGFRRVGIGGGEPPVILFERSL